MRLAEGSGGVAAAAAAGALMTVTGTVGGLCFAAWAGADRLRLASRRHRKEARPVLAELASKLV